MMLSDLWAVRTHRNGSVVDQNLSVTFVLFFSQQADLSKHLAIYDVSSARKLPSRVTNLPSRVAQPSNPCRIKSLAD
jgi:hypothetical protein